MTRTAQNIARTATRALLLAALLLLSLASCKRRPLTELDSNVLVNITYDRDIVNYTMSSDPSMMRIIFYDSASGQFSAQAFTPSAGDYVNVLPGRDYHVLVYNFDTENTVISEEDRHSDILATTNQVPESYRSRLRTRGNENPEEAIVFEPDHLFTGNVTDVHIITRGIDAPTMVIDVEASTIVETWILEVDKIQGMKWVASISGVISGLTESTALSSREKADRPVSVFFEPSSVDADGKMTGKFNTFGSNSTQRQIVSLVITDTGGTGHRVDVDVTDQFLDNPEQIIRIRTDNIIITEPENVATGGGLAPEVDRWDDITVTIPI